MNPTQAQCNFLDILGRISHQVGQLSRVWDGVENELQNMSHCEGDRSLNDIDGELCYIPDEIIDYVKNELQCEGRVKYTVFETPCDNSSSWKWCFKFKDETAAMAFKLRWL